MLSAAFAVLRRYVAHQSIIFSNWVILPSSCRNGFKHPATFTHAGVSLEHKEQLGITPGLVRLSVGVEHHDDLLYDLDQALQEV
jgi:O-acetylhomoserine/O-acetylserine sulfhydrylase-like pyridoxal-dependent enzyme